MSSNWRLLLLALGTSETNRRFGLIRPAATQLPVPFHHNCGRAPHFARTQCPCSVDRAQGSGRTTIARRMDQLWQLHAKTRCWRNHQRLELQGLSLWHVLREEDTLAPRRLFHWRPQSLGSCVCYPWFPKVARASSRLTGEDKHAKSIGSHDNCAHIGVPAVGKKESI